MHALVLLFAIVSFQASPAFLSGRVLDQSTGEPLHRVLVSLTGTEIRTVTDEQGRYSLRGIPSGTYTLYVSTIGYRLLRREIHLADGEARELDILLGQEAATIRELVTVEAPLFEEVERVAASQLSLTGTELENLSGVLLDDPLRSVQTLPGVAAGDDFHAYYSVRGGAFRNNGIVVDGVLTHNLVHTVQGTRDPTGSVTILNGDLVESIALYTGGFSARYGDRTASYLEVVTRDGSRDAPHARLAVSGTNAAFVTEGPLDKARRGSWIVSARKSYADYIVRRVGPESDINMGFWDVQGKLSYELSSRHRLGATFTSGRARVGRDPSRRGVGSLIEGLNKVVIGSAVWSYAPTSRILWENRFYVMRESFDNRNKNAEILGEGDYEEAAVRSDFSWQVFPRHRFEAGALLRSVGDDFLERRYDSRQRRFYAYDSFDASYRQDAFYAQDRWEIARNRLTTVLGVRAERSGLTGQVVTNPRAGLEWRPSKRHRIDAGWGVFTQFPETAWVLGRNGNPDQRAEVSRHAILGYELLLTPSTRLRLELYNKEESNLERAPDSLHRFAGGKVVSPRSDFRYDNALRGRSRGFEVFLQRRSANRLAGWISYAFSSSERRDLVTGEVYPGDFQQRHTVNLYGSYRFREDWNLSVKARFGSNFPYPGYFERRGEDMFITSVRNREVLPYYGRVDLRLNKAFFLEKRKLSLYIEVLNVVNRRNFRYEKVYDVNPVTGRVSLGRDTVLPFLPTAGFVLDF